MTRRASSRWRWIVGAAVTLATIPALVMGLLWAGVIHLNNPSRDRYPVWGVDVSRYQGTIDWPVLAAQDIEFAIAKSTEGSSYVDPQFAANLSGARAAGLRVGAYHFFSYESPGQTQADNMIRTVPADDDLLPPTVDVEYYGEFWTNPAPADDVRRELTAMLTRLEAHYGKRPTVYATTEAYDRYLAGGFDGVDIWIRDVQREPMLADGRSWTFWQFSDRHRWPGYDGEEPFIDVNVYAGTRADWDGYGR